MSTSPNAISISNFILEGNLTYSNFGKLRENLKPYLRHCFTYEDNFLGKTEAQVSEATLRKRQCNGETICKAQKLTRRTFRG